MRHHKHLYMQLSVAPVGHVPPTFTNDWAREWGEGRVLGVEQQLMKLY